MSAFSTVASSPGDLLIIRLQGGEPSLGSLELRALGRQCGSLELRVLAPMAGSAAMRSRRGRVAELSSGARFQNPKWRHGARVGAVGSGGSHCPSGRSRDSLDAAHEIGVLRWQHGRICRSRCQVTHRSSLRCSSRCWRAGMAARRPLARWRRQEPRGGCRAWGQSRCRSSTMRAAIAWMGAVRGSGSRSCTTRSSPRR